MEIDVAHVYIDVLLLVWKIIENVETKKFLPRDKSADESFV